MPKRKQPKPEESFEVTGSRPLERHTLGLIGLIPDQIIEPAKLFRESDRPSLEAALREGGLIWANRSLDDFWESDEEEARRRALFDLIWHRRALELDPFVMLPDFAGFDVLLDVATEIHRDLGLVLARIDGNNPDNPRATDGPDWWQAWHYATRSRSGGWLDRQEVREVAELWDLVSTPEVEEVCLQVMGVPYTHPGCWTLLEQLGGFFAQCASENRAVAVEVDL